MILCRIMRNIYILDVTLLMHCISNRMIELAIINNLFLFLSFTRLNDNKNVYLFIEHDLIVLFRKKRNMTLFNYDFYLSFKEITNKQSIVFHNNWLTIQPTWNNQINHRRIYKLSINVPVILLIAIGDHR